MNTVKLQKLTDKQIIEAKMLGMSRFCLDMVEICKGVENIDNKTLCQIVASLARLAEEHAECKE